MSVVEGPFLWVTVKGGSYFNPEGERRCADATDEWWGDTVGVGAWGDDPQAENERDVTTMMLDSDVEYLQAGLDKALADPQRRLVGYAWAPTHDRENERQPAVFTTA